MAVLHRITSNPFLGQRDFRVLSADSVCYATGTGGETVVVGLLVFQITGSSTWVGIALALYFAPLLLVGAPAGAIADWLPRRSLLRATQLAIGGNFILIGLLIGSGVIELWHILTMTFVSGVVRSMYQPVRLSYVYDLVGGEHVVSGLAFIQIANRIGQGVGSVIGGSVMQRLGPEYAYVTLALAHLIAFVILGALRAPGGVAAHERVSLGRTFLDYAREMRSNRTLLMLVVVTAGVNVFGFSFLAALPELATERLAVGAEGLGMLHAGRAVGGMIAAGGLALFGSQLRPGMLYIIVIHGFGAGLLLLAIAPSFAAALLVLLMVSASASLSDVLSQSMMQRCVPDRLRGRAMGAWMIAIGGSPVGQLEMGALAAGLGVDVALALNALALIGCALAATLGAPRLLRL